MVVLSIWLIIWSREENEEEQEEEEEEYKRRRRSSSNILTVNSHGSTEVTRAITANIGHICKYFMHIFVVYLTTIIYIIFMSTLSIIYLFLFS